jgi:hypothetical protein
MGECIRMYCPDGESLIVNVFLPLSDNLFVTEVEDELQQKKPD